MEKRLSKKNFPPWSKPFIIFLKEKIKENNNTNLWIADTTRCLREKMRAFFYLYDFSIKSQFWKEDDYLKPFPHWKQLPDEGLDRQPSS